MKMGLGTQFTLVFRRLAAALAVLSALIFALETPSRADPTITSTAVTLNLNATDFPGAPASTASTPGTDSGGVFASGLGQVSWLSGVSLSTRLTCARFTGAGSAYTVTESSCSSIAAGTGAPDDPVALKIFVNRGGTGLAATENLKLTLTYTASGAASNSSAAISAPGKCVDSATGSFSLASASCSEQSYALFVRARDTASASKLMVVIPPQKGTETSRSVVVPLAALSSDQTVLQLTRIFGAATGSAMLILKTLKIERM